MNDKTLRPPRVPELLLVPPAELPPGLPPPGLPPELPADLERTPPGPELSALLAAIDRGALSARDRIRLARARNRLASHVQSELLADLCAVSGDSVAGGDPPAGA